MATTLKRGVIGLLLLIASTVCAAPPRYRLYSKPDPEAPGGITGYDPDAEPAD